MKVVVAFVVLVMLAGVYAETCQVFVNPRREIKSEYGAVEVAVDACVTLGEECQGPAAVRFCTEAGFSNATAFDGSAECMVTATADHSVCEVRSIARHHCGCFNFIQCC